MAVEIRERHGPTWRQLCWLEPPRETRECDTRYKCENEEIKADRKSEYELVQRDLWENLVSGTMIEKRSVASMIEERIKIISKVIPSN